MVLHVAVRHGIHIYHGSQRSIKVIVHDARGHGLSSAPRGEEQNSWEALADDLNRLNGTS